MVRTNPWKWEASRIDFNLSYSRDCPDTIRSELPLRAQSPGNRGQRLKVRLVPRRSGPKPFADEHTAAENGEGS